MKQIFWDRDCIIFLCPITVAMLSVWNLYANVPTIIGQGLYYFSYPIVVATFNVLNLYANVTPTLGQGSIIFLSLSHNCCYILYMKFICKTENFPYPTVVLCVSVKINKRLYFHYVPFMS